MPDFAAREARLVEVNRLIEMLEKAGLPWLQCEGHVAAWRFRHDNRHCLRLDILGLGERRVPRRGVARHHLPEKEVAAFFDILARYIRKAEKIPAHYFGEHHLFHELPNVFGMARGSFLKLQAVMCGHAMVQRFWTDYPVEALGDRSGEPAPMRECLPLDWDSNKYVRVVVEGHEVFIKAGYIHVAPDAEAKTIWNCGHLDHLPYGPGPYDHVLERVRRELADGIPEMS